ncbi:hypothetical protein EBR66_04055 [bacterium]|nr:hypothetical protein [bacterium]
MNKGMAAFWISLLILIVGGSGASWYLNNHTGSNKLDGFAQCLKDKGVVFYGAFWCAHCQKTKAMFSRSAALLPYVECSTQNAQDQTPICKEKGIKSYPTWKFPDGSELVGEHTLQEFADKSGCALPQ